jgi:hypothetical protein
MQKCRKFSYQPYFAVIPVLNRDNHKLLANKVLQVTFQILLFIINKCKKKISRPAAKPVMH